MANANWTAAGNGSWDDGANWSSGLVPGGVGAPNDSATLDAPGSYTVTVGTAAGTSVDTVNLNAAGATLGVSTGGVTVRTALNLNSGRLLLNGVLKGGTLAMNGGVVMRNDAAALDGVRVLGTLDLSAPYSYGALTLLNYGQLTLLNNTRFVAADGTSPGLVRVGGSALTFGNSAQFDNAAIDFLAGYRTASYLNLGTDDPGSVGETVTFGHHAVLDVAANATVTLGGNGTLVNGGAINVAGTLTVDLDANLAQAAQPGTVTLQGGGTLAFAAQMAYGGTVAFKGAGAQLQFQGAGVASATLQDFQSGDSIDLQGLAYGGDVALSFLGGAVQVSQGGVLMGRFQLTGGPASYGADQFSLAADDAGGTVLKTTHVLNAEPDFDAVYYLAHNPDVAAAGADPLQHYLTYGWKEGRDPNAYFSTNGYLAQNPDVAAARFNPLEHFENYGWKEGRDPSANFSISKYLAAYADVRAAGVDPLQQFLTVGRTHGYVASPVTPAAPPAAPADPLVDKAWYLAQHPDVAASGEDAAANYHRVGWKLGYNPDQFFDTTYYLKANPDVAAAGADPLAHFETYGVHEGRQPSLAFSDDKYLAQNPDVAAAKVNPLAHYLAYGRAEGRMAFMTEPQAAGAPDPLVDRAYYYAQFATIVPAAADASASYDQTGWRHGLNPDAYFDTNYYLAHNPDVRAADIDPLKHYETFGWKEGRDASAAFSTNKYLAAYADVRASGADPLVNFVTTGQAQGRTAFAV